MKHRLNSGNLPDGTILSEAQNIGNVQRPERKLVGSSEPKQAGPNLGQDMVRSNGQPLAVYVCKKCGVPKILPDDFYGANRVCKVCQKARITEWQATVGHEKHLHSCSRYRSTGKANLDNARYKLTDKGRASNVRYLRSLRNRHPEKVAARQAVRNAIRDGILAKPEGCSKCGEVGYVEAHHPDYSKPLEVKWLCLICHMDEHEVATYAERNG